MLKRTALSASTILVVFSMCFAADYDPSSKAAELASADAPTRLAAIGELGASRDSAAARMLGDHLKTEADAYLRDGVIQALAVNHTEAALDALIEALDNPDPRVREAAATNIRYFGVNRKAREALAGLLAKESDPEVKINSVGTLISVGDEQALETAGDAMVAEKDPKVRMFAVRGLRNGGDKSAAQLKRFENDPDKGVRDAARQRRAGRPSGRNNR